MPLPAALRRPVLPGLTVAGESTSGVFSSFAVACDATTKRANAINSLVFTRGPGLERLRNHRPVADRKIFQCCTATPRPISFSISLLFSFGSARDESEGDGEPALRGAPGSKIKRERKRKMTGVSPPQIFSTLV